MRMSERGTGMTPKKTVRFRIRDVVHFCRIRRRPSVRWTAHKRTEMEMYNKETRAADTEVDKKDGRPILYTRPFRGPVQPRLVLEVR
jgi:hypothetical protein